MNNVNNMMLATCDYCKREIYSLQESIMIITKTRLWVYHPDCHKLDNQK